MEKENVMSDLMALQKSMSFNAWTKECFKFWKKLSTIEQDRINQIILCNFNKWITETDLILFAK